MVRATSDEMSFLTTVASARAALAQGHAEHCLVILQRGAFLDTCADVAALLLASSAAQQLRAYDLALEYATTAAAADVHCPDAFCAIAIILRELGDVKMAIQFALRALADDPRHCKALSTLGAALLQCGRTGPASAALACLVALRGATGYDYINLGSALLAQNALLPAAQAYAAAAHELPGCALPAAGIALVARFAGVPVPHQLSLWQSCTEIDPWFADGWTHTASLLREAGNPQGALAAFARAVAAHPSQAMHWVNVASWYYSAGDMLRATGLYLESLARPHTASADVYNNLGNALRELKRPDVAALAYHAALFTAPDHPHAWNNLGNALKDRAATHECLVAYLTAVNLCPTFAAAHSNLASALKEQGYTGPAAAHYQVAIKADPRFADAYSGLGNVYKDLGRHHEAIVCYSAAVLARPQFPEAWANVASAYKDSGRVQEAVVAYQHALRLRPQFPDALANLVHAKLVLCDWRARTADFAQLDALVGPQVSTALPSTPINVHAPAAQTLALFGGGAPALPAVQPFHSLVYPVSVAHMKRLAQCYACRAELAVALLAAKPTFNPPAPPAPRLRVGYVSSDFGNHPLAHLMQSVFGMHDRSRLEVIAFALSPDDGSVWRRRIEREVEHFVDCSMYTSPVDVARVIAGHGVHVLVNLNGYTKGARNEVFALRPAPIAVSYMGFCGTMGAQFIDYLVADKTVVPDSVRAHYTEALAYMPHCYFVNDHRQSSRAVLHTAQLPRRANYGIPADVFVFANFNQLYKIDPRTFAVWMRILRRVPNSILWLLRFPPAGEANIRAAAAAFGVAAHRLHFTDVAPKEVHIARGPCADLFLDTPACNAHTTGCDILWGGVPMVTVPGEKMACRVAASLLNAAGLAECVAGSLAEYEELAVELATHPAKLQALRRRLCSARDACPLFDTARWVRNLEGAYLAMWQQHAAGKPPASFQVPDVAGAPCRPMEHVAPLVLDVHHAGGSAADTHARVAPGEDRPGGGAVCLWHGHPEVEGAEATVAAWMSQHPAQLPTAEAVLDRTPVVLPPEPAALLGGSSQAAAMVAHARAAARSSTAGSSSQRNSAGQVAAANAAASIAAQAVQQLVSGQVSAATSAMAVPGLHIGPAAPVQAMAPGSGFHGSIVMPAPPTSVRRLPGPPGAQTLGYHSGVM